MLLLFVLGTLEVLVLLEDLVVFVGGIFERVESPFFLGKKKRIQKESYWCTKEFKNP